MFLAVRESAGGFGAAKGCGERKHAERKKDGGEQEQDGEWVREFADSDRAEERGAHGVECVGDGIEASEKLEPVRKYGNGEEHSAGDARDAEEKPFGWIATLEEEQVAGGENAESRKGKQRHGENEEDGEPVGGVKRKAEEDGAPGEIDGDAERCCGEGIYGRASEDCGKGSLRDEKMFERAGVAGFFKAAVKGVQRGVEVVEKGKADERESEVAATLRKGVAKFRTVHEARDVIEHGGAEQGLDGLEDDGAAVGFCDLQVAPEEEKKFQKEVCHERACSAGRSWLWPASRKNASSRECEEVLCMRAAGESSAMR